MIMISTFTMAMMVVCILVGVAVPFFCILFLKGRSSKIETGLAGAVGYGMLGYVWQYVFYVFIGAFLAKMPIPGSLTVRFVILQFLLTLVSTGCTAASLYWGIYLTNQKQLSLYRSAAVGIGFSLGKLGIELVYPYAYKFYLSLQMNAGTCRADEQIQQWVADTTAGSLISGWYTCFVMFIIVFGIALVMGKYYVQDRKKMSWVFVIVVYEAIMIMNLALGYLFRSTELGMDIALTVVLTLIAAASGVILWHWFRHDEVVVNPLDIILGK